MKRMFVVVAVVMALTLALGVASVGAQGPMGGGYGGQMGFPMGGSQMGFPMGGGFWGPFYHVRYGETLSEIGFKVGVPYWQLARVNGIPNPNIIFAGQKLIIPQRPYPFPMGYGQQWPGYGFGGGFGGGYASWSSGGYSSWGGYPWGGYPYGGGYNPMPFGGGMMPYADNHDGGWGAAQMPMGASF